MKDRIEQAKRDLEWLAHTNQQIQARRRILALITDLVSERDELKAGWEFRADWKARSDEWEATAFTLACWLVAYRRYEPPTGICTWSEEHNEWAHELVEKARQENSQKEVAT